MEVMLSPGYKGKQVENYKKANLLIRTAKEDCMAGVSYNKKTYIQVDDETSKMSFVFSMYQGEKVSFSNKAIGPWYRSFISCYPLSECAEWSKDRFQVEGGKVKVNEKWQGKWVKCYAYDINSSYPSVLLGKMPDVNKPLSPGIVKDGEVGFVESYDTGCLKLVKVGEVAEYRYKEIDSPWRKWAKEQYYQLQEAKRKGDMELKEKLKMKMVAAIGCLRNHNPFLYCYIITKATENVMKYWNDETTIKVNVDCIYSAVPLDDILPIGKELGMFKIVEESGNEIYCSGANSVWRNSETKEKMGEGRSLRGIPTVLQDSYDIESGIVTLSPDYELNEKKLIKKKKKEKGV